MELKNSLEQTMFDAMRNKDYITRDTIRLVFSNIKQAEVESRKSLDDSGILSILQKEIKIRKETISELSGTDRVDLLNKANSEISVLEKFLPKQLSDEEITGIVSQVISELGASSPSDMGKIMKAVIPLVVGKAPPDRVSRIVKELLTG